MALAGGFSAADQRNFCHAPSPAAPAPADPGKAPAHSLPACALCQAVHAIGGFAPPTAAGLAAVVSFEAVTFAPANSATMTGRRLHNRQQPRAPPVLA